MAREEFEQALRDDLDESLGEKARDYTIGSLLATVLDVSDLEDTPRRERSIIADHLIRILTSERNRIERIERWNKRSAGSTPS